MRDLVDELLRAQVRARLFGDFVAPRLGRLELVARLGGGAMGTVFAADDPRLERKVAVKVLRDPGGDRARVLAEARALGKLAHPNVVAVHDADELDDTVYIVMELAPGPTLRAWLATPRPWRAIAAALCEAGAGIAAAHRAGLVHRDVKPDNILVGDDRVRVVDFGLAGSDAIAAGTPSYMAPEVLAGAPATAASDQFSFAVVCYEALRGERPHAGATREALAASAAHAAEAPAFEPRWLHAVIARGLAAEPARRFPSLEALVAAIRRGLERRRHRTYALVAAALVLGGAAGVLGMRGHPAPCDGGAARRAATWTPASAKRVFGATQSMRAVDALDTGAARWEASFRAVCEATRVRGEQSDQLLELRMRCLDRALDRTAALVAALDGPLDGAARASAVTAIVELPDPAACETVRDVGDLALPAEPAQRARALAADHQLDRGWALFGLGRYREARTAIAGTESATAEAPALRATALALDAAVEARIGPAAAARTRLEAALQAAAAAHAPELELEIWARLLRLELFTGDGARAIEQAPFARAAAARAGLDGAELDGIVGEALRDANRLAEARAILERALASRDPLRPGRRAVIEMNLGSVLLAAGDPVGALAAFTHAEAAARAVLGDDHPELALHADKLAAALRARGQLRDALAQHARSLELRRRAFGDDDRAVATSLFHRAQTYLEGGALALARADLARARTIRVAAWGEASPRLGEIDAALGDVEAAAGNAEAARALHERAVALDPRVQRPAPPAAREAYAQWRALTGIVDPAQSCAVAEALDAAGDRAAAATVFAAARAALVGDEPSRTRLCVLTGLRADVTALRALMPELK